MVRTYDKAIGYSPLESVELDRLQILITINKTVIDDYFIGGDGDWILVAGAGLGYEGQLVHSIFGLKTIAVDINIHPVQDTIGISGLYFQKQNLINLAFNENAFSLIYSYHVLEHVNDHLRALEELYRVLCPGGVMFIGFPNKNRLFSYLGTSQKAALFEKIKWNMNDYVHRLRGTYENRYGAHAGFTEKEFLSAVHGLFISVIPVRNQYMLTKYAKYYYLIRKIIQWNLAEILFPSNYFICLKE